MDDNPSTQSHGEQNCAHCGAVYAVLVTKKVAASEDDRIVCECGWPLKDWVGIKKYIFRRVRGRQSGHAAPTSGAS
jgi:hypothetical protein